MVAQRPYNWNGCAVRIESLERSGPTVDPVFRTPISHKSRPVSYVYNAQINQGRKDANHKTRTDSGNRPETNAHIVLRTCDLAPYTELPRPETGWKITGLYVGEAEEIEVDYLIEQVRYESPWRGRPLLVYVEYQHNRDRGQG